MAFGICERAGGREAGGLSNFQSGWDSLGACEVALAVYYTI